MAATVVSIKLVATPTGTFRTDATPPVVRVIWYAVTELFAGAAAQFNVICVALLAVAEAPVSVGAAVNPAVTVALEPCVPTTVPFTATTV